MRLYLIRHLKTKGNYERRYIGRTDEGLYEPQLQSLPKELPKTSNVYTSPMRRCLETAKLLYPEVEPITIQTLMEIDFGIFENHSYEELADNPDYIRFIDSNGTGTIPGGEDTIHFKKRCCDAFLQITEQMKVTRLDLAVIISHGGTIMSILEQLEGSRSFYDYQVKNGEGYEVEYNPETNKITILKELI